MYYPSFYTTPQYYSFSSTATTPPPDFNKIIKSLPVANAGNQGKVQPGGFITTKKPTVVDNKGLEPVGGPTLGGLLPTGTGTHGTCSDIGIPDEICNFINKPCETINLPPEICKYFPAILLGVAALAIFGLLKWIL